MNYQESGIVLLGERNLGRHRFYYVRLLAKAALVNGDNVQIALGSGALKSTGVSIFLAFLAGEATITERSDPSLGAIARLSRELSAKIFVIPDGDCILCQLARARVRMGPKKLLILMGELARGKQGRKAPSLKSWAKRILISWTRAMPDVRVSVLKSSTSNGSSVHAIAGDPVTPIASQNERDDLRAQSGLTPDRYWLAFRGAITSRKNRPLAAKPLSSLGNPHLGILAGGACDAYDRERAELALTRFVEHGGKVVFLDRLLPDVEIDSAISSMDCLVLAHSHEGPSGLFGKKAINGTRVVAAGTPSLRGDCEATCCLANWVPLEASTLAKEFLLTSLLPRPIAINGLGVDAFTKAFHD